MKKEQWACVLMNGKEWTVQASVVNLSKSVDDAIKKSDKLAKMGTLTIVREI